MSIDLVSLGSNLALIDELYDRYKENGEEVDPSWKELFEKGTYTPRQLPPAQKRRPAPATSARAAAAGSSVGEDTLAVWPLINVFRTRGHMLARLDPLDLLERPHHPELGPAGYGFSDGDLDEVFPVSDLHGMPHHATLREILAKLERTYCGSIGIEFMHISTPVKRDWLSRRMETLDERRIDPDTQRAMLERLIAAETLEKFCHVKYPGTKRFSLQGGESFIPLLDMVLLHGARLGAIEAVLGMAHRGRLNVLVNTMGMPVRDLFAEFEDIEPESTLGGGDVKYHLGYSYDREDRLGNTMHLSLAFNPSHLEAVDPVVVGRVRAKQTRHDDWEHRRVLGVLIHGDAAFAGQGLVMETLNLTNLHGYRTGGTVHIIINNQIGFTAVPHESRSTPYCTDLAKMIQCPIFHVNGEDLDAVAHVVEMAMEYRAQFQSDVVIDMFCYRKFGHNEMDEPSFTNPIMYKRIRDKKPIDQVYGERLVADGLITSDEIEAMVKNERDELEAALEHAKAADKRPRSAAFGGIWADFVGGPEGNVADVDTGVPIERLREIAERTSTVPEGFTPHRKISRLLDQRREMGHGERRLDWGMAEILAYGSLVWEGYNVRLTGQDSSRGTFSHRHAMLTDVDTGTEYMPLSNLHPDQAECRIYDSPLSEAGVLGFEFGYSLDMPDALVVWEAQFGDFANGAQMIIDQFIVASEDKWSRLSGLVMLLPHGYEGMGPEHSSARLERYLQSMAEDCCQVCQPTTPAQMFHLLRRQVLRPWRKPLIVMSPKSLLRLPAASSDLAELGSGRFKRVLGDPSPPPVEKVDRVFLCSGKVVYDLLAEREARGDERTAIVRIEELYPWRSEELRVAVDAYDNAREIVWVQDEPHNMGAWGFVAPRLHALFGADRVREVTREESASPATGSSKAHALEHQILMDQAFGPRKDQE
jgi:2-oxoglutarate dehydrogenase E1 component